MRIILVSAILVLTLSSRGDVFAVSATQMAVSPHRYDLVRWHAQNFLSKWLHRVVRATPGMGISDAERLAAVERYFQLGHRMNEIKPQIEAASSDRRGRVMPTWPCSNPRWNGFADSASQSAAMWKRRSSPRSAQPRAHSDWGQWGPLLLPPVDVRLSEPPKVLVTSPRNRIERLEDVLIDPGVTVETQERVEAAMMADSDLSALVLDIGGVATYPASIHASGDLRWTLHITAHEWLHHYLFFRPLGRNIHRSPEMQRSERDRVRPRRSGDQPAGL